MEWTPVRPNKKEIEAVDIDPENSDLVIIKIPLNRNPKLEWEYFFENPEVLKGPDPFTKSSREPNFGLGQSKFSCRGSRAYF